ncbi:unnamed protein product [Phytophthora fragariaefolia]|uniref:Unnamed protein product n=1 Tax=Phytophthora fragariaefolia TaxID=1490495 RepID=A0A9W7DBQ6_9STRA|nr:unnamed protein product [Phytophthora fragariaefolia]
MPGNSQTRSSTPDLTTHVCQAYTQCEWIRKAWRDTDEATIYQSVQAAGFASEPVQWFIAKHNVYGRKFREQWNLEEDCIDVDQFNLHASADAPDDISQVDV